MRKFSFGLQGVLGIKEKLESQAKMNFGLAKAALNEEERKRDELVLRKQEYQEKLRILTSSRLDIIAIRQCENAIDVLSEQLEVQILAVKRAEKQAELARIKLNEAMLEKKTIEKLKEQALEEYREEYNADERKQVDELTSYKHSRREENIS